MKARTIVPLVIGLGVGFFAIKMGIDLVQRAKGAQGGEGVVLTSAKQIDVATKITAAMLSTKKVPEALVSADAFTESKNLIGRVTGMTISVGVPITTAMLAPPGSEPGLRAIIPQGMRAVSISVNEETAVAGFIMPGCRVDVSAAAKDGGTSKLVLTDVEVGAVGQSMSRVGEDGKTVRMEKSVTLFLKPEEVQALHQFTGTGRMRLALRGNDKDPGESAFAKFLKNALASKTPPQPVVMARKQPRQHVVDVVRGEEYEKVLFGSNGTMKRYAVERAQLPPGVDPATYYETAATATPRHAPSREVGE